MAKKKLAEGGTVLLDSSVPWEHRRQILMQMALDADCQPLLEGIMTAAANSKVDEVMQAKLKSVDELIDALNSRPLRPATFVGWHATGKSIRRAHVKTADGTSAFVAVADEALAGSLRCGDEVLLDGRMHAVLLVDSSQLPIG